ncbi:MAG TPA: efflux RND transporter periplasmic adaptor subunit, partial [Ignavibacteria bacterium]
LRPGMSCTVDIEVNKKDNVISVPIQSVTTRDDESKTNNTMQDDKDKPESLSDSKETKSQKKIKPKEIVFIIENGVAKKKEVKTGISNDTYIEVIEGLNENEEVVKGTFKAINKDLDDNSKVKVNNEKKKMTDKQ